MAVKTKGGMMTNYEDDFIRIINKPNQYKPEMWTRELRRVQVGTWLFGLLPVYKYQYTEWEKNEC
jgi:hypothetical protein